MNKENDWFERLFRKKDEIKKQIMSNDDYINWLIDFLETHEDGLLDINPAIDVWSDDDKENFAKLTAFFHVVADYAKRNYIEPVPYRVAEVYNVKYNGHGLEVASFATNNCFWCKKAEIVDGKPFIDFNDVLTDRQQPYVPYIEDCLGDISTAIESAYECGAPITVIKSVIEEALSNLEKHEADKPKCLTRDKE